jgi:hypothetical protein
VQSLIAANVGTHDPDNYVIGAISGGNERRATPVLDNGPFDVDDRRIGWSNAESWKVTDFGVESDIGSLIGAISDSRLENRAVAKLRRSNRLDDATEVVSINQIHIAVLTHCNHKVWRRCTRHVHQ